MTKMPKTIHAFALALVATPIVLWAQADGSKPASSIVEMRDKSRPLLVFHAAAEGNAQLATQLLTLKEHTAELVARDVVVMPVPHVDGFSAIPAGEELQLRRKFHIPENQLTVILIGKDGGEKFRSHEPVTIEKLEALIDAMPMRQQEVRDGHRPE